MNRILSLMTTSSLLLALSLPGCKSKPAEETPATTTAEAQQAQATPGEPKPDAAKQEPPKQEAPTQELPKQESPKQEPAKKDEAKPAESKPADTKPADTKPDEKKPEPAKPDLKKEEPKKEEAKPAVTFLNCDKAEALSTKKLDSGVIVEDLKLGEGSECKSGATVTINYHGTLKDGGTMFDTTRGKQPATFPLNRLIKGWQQGVPGMKPGGIRRLTIPYAQAYGESGRPPVIPAKADLVFIIELIGVVEPAK
jgi:FKBP-type peptidyl-prolyl cis-trans isomerase